LFSDAIEQGLHVAGGNVEFGFEHRAQRAKRVKALAASPLLIEGLVIAHAHIVQARIPRNVRPDVVAVLQLGTLLRNDDGKLTFIIHALNIWRKNNGIFGREKRRWRLEKNQRLFGWELIKLSGVVDIIPAEADDLARCDRRQQLHIGERPGPVRDAPPAKNVAGDFADSLTGNDVLKNFRVHG